MAEEECVKPSAFESVFKSVWGVLAVVITIVSLTFGVNNYISKNFPSNDDLRVQIEKLEQILMSKPEFWKIVRGLEDRLDKAEKKDEYLKKEFKEDSTKLRAEYRTEKLIDTAMRLKVVDEVLLKDPNNQTLKNYREYLCKEYDRLQNKLDNSLRDLEK